MRRFKPLLRQLGGIDLLKIVEGSLCDVNSELKQLVKSKRAEVADLKMSLKLAKKELNQLKKKQHHKEKHSDAVNMEIFQMELDIKKREEVIKKKSEERDHIASYFKVSVMLPVRIGTIVINYKLYELMLKKLDGFKVKCELKEDKLQLNYRSNSSIGTLELYDISNQISGLKNIPVAVITEGGE